MEKRYEIGGKVYVQRPAVLAQINVVLPILAEIWPQKKPKDGRFLIQIGKETPRFLAAILIEEGLTVRKALDDLDGRAREIEDSATSEQAVEVIADFFGMSPFLHGLLMNSAKAKTGSAPKGSSIDSPEGTSPEETESSTESPGEP